MYNLGLRKLGIHFGQTFGRQVAVSFIQLFIVVIIARTLGPEGNGEYILAILFPQMLSFFLNFGIPNSNVYYIGSSTISLPAAWRYNVKLFIPLTLAGLAAGVLMITFFTDTFFQGVNKDILWLSLSLFPLMMMSHFMTSVMQGAQNFKAYNQILLSQPVASVVLISVLLLLGYVDLFCILAAYAAGFVISLLIGWRQINKTVRLCEPSADTQKQRPGKEVILYGLKSQSTNLFHFLNYRTDIFIVNYFLGPFFTGLYIVSVKIAEKMWILPATLSVVLFPRLSELSREEGTEKKSLLTAFTSRITTSSTLACSLVLALFACPLIILLFGQEFTEAFLPLLILLPGMVAGSVSKIFTSDIAAKGRPEINMKIAAAMLLLNIVLNVLLIPYMGISGAALATSISYSGDACLKLYYISHLSSIRYARYLIVSKHDLRQLFAAIKKKS